MASRASKPARTGADRWRTGCSCRPPTAAGRSPTRSARRTKLSPSAVPSPASRRRCRRVGPATTSTCPAPAGQPIFEVGVELTAPVRAEGTVYLDTLTWEGPPDTRFQRGNSGEMWRRAWVIAADRAEFRGSELARVMQGAGTGLLI